MKRHAVMCIVTGVMLIVGVFISAADDNPVVATEHWESTIEHGGGEGEWTVTKQSDGTLSITGEWTYTYMGTVTCPFNEGIVKMEGPSFTFSAKGEATNDSAPPGFQTSPFNLKVKGETRSGEASGTFTITFFAPEWPSGMSGKWTAIRIAGEGITE